METLKEIMEKLGGDPYDILNTPPAGEFALLKKNYRMLALKYHPDRNKDDEATERFIKINRAYEFLEIENNRKLYADHIRAIEEQKQRIEAMGAERRILIQNLKRREEEKSKAREDMQAEAKRRKDFYEKKMQQEEERQQLRRQINQQMSPQQYYEEMSSVVVRWQRGLSFTKNLLEAAFHPYGEITSINIEPVRKKAIIIFNSIEKAASIVQEFRHPMITLELKISGERRSHLLSVLKRRKTELDLSLSSENIARLKEIINRKSNLFFENPLPSE